MPKMISSREFNQNVSAAKRAAETKPVIISDRGRPALVLMSIEHYRRLTEAQPNIVELLATTGGDYVEFEPARLKPGELQVPDFS